MEKEFYKFEWIFNRDICDELKYHVTGSKGSRLYLIALMTLLMIFGLRSFWLQQFGIGIIYFMIVIVSTSLYFFMVRGWAKTTFKRNLEITGREEIVATLMFMGNQIEIENLISENKSQLKYEHIVRLVETKNHYILLTKALLFININKYNFINFQQEQEFLTFIRNKCVNLKGKK